MTDQIPLKIPFGREIIYMIKIGTKIHIRRTRNIIKETIKSRDLKDSSLHHLETIITLINKDRPRKTKPNGESIQTKG